MPFGLKNVDATFMRMIQKCLLTQISRNVEAYMDDIVVKSRKGSDLFTNLAETFPISGGMISSSILQSAHSEYLAGSYSVFSFPNEESMLTQKKLALYSE